MSANGEMGFRKKYIVLIAIAILGVLASLYVNHKPAAIANNVAPTGVAVISDATVVSSANNKAIQFTFPYYRVGVDGEKLNFNFRIAYAPGQWASYQIIPDDCLEALEINGKSIELSAEAKAQRCNWHQGFKIDLKPYLHEGSNDVHILVRNISGWTGLNMQLAK